MNIDQQLKHVWLLEVTHANSRYVTRGGAFCIDDTGLMLTAAHVLSVEGYGPQGCEFLARSFEDNGFRQVDLVEVYPALDIGLIRLRRTGNEMFNYLQLQENIRVEVNESIVSHGHCSSLPFSTQFGNTCYPYHRTRPLNILLRDFNLTVGPNPTRSRPGPYQSFRDVWSCIDANNMQVNNLHPHMPLLQVEHFVTTPGMSGCPAFRESGEFVGMVSFMHGHYHYIIPVDVLYYVIDYCRRNGVI